MKNLTKIFKTVALLTSLILSVACSQQSRDTDWDPTSDELGQSIESLFSEAGGGGVLAEAQNNIQSTENPAVFYYGESGSTGVPMSVASVLDFSIFGMPSASLFDVEEAKVLLVDTYTLENREFTLVLQVRFANPNSASAGSYITRSFKTNVYEFTDDKLVISFQDFDLHTFDLSDIEDDLAPVIQLKISDKEGVNYGKFSTLLGFGG